MKREDATWKVTSKVACSSEALVHTNLVQNCYQLSQRFFAYSKVPPFGLGGRRRRSWSKSTSTRRISVSRTSVICIVDLLGESLRAGLLNVGVNFSIRPVSRTRVSGSMTRPQIPQRYPLRGTS